MNVRWFLAPLCALLMAAAPGLPAHGAPEEAAAQVPDMTVTGEAEEAAARVPDMTVTGGAEEAATQVPDITVTGEAEEAAAQVPDMTVTGEAEEAATQVPDITVTGEAAGPGLWHIRHGTAELWIFGTASPLPKDMTWRSKQLEAILEHTDLVLATKPVDIGFARALWLMVTQRDLLLAGHGNKLKNVMPAELYARFAMQRAKFAKSADKWEKYRPIVAAAFLEEEALHQVGLSTRLDLGEEVRSLAHKHRVRVDEIKVAGWHDILDALKTLPRDTEYKCVGASLATLETGLPPLVERGAAWATGNIEKIQSLPEPREVSDCRGAIMGGGTAGDLLAQMRRTWLDRVQERLNGSGTTVAVVSIDLLLQPGGFLDELRARGYSVDPP